MEKELEDILLLLKIGLLNVPMARKQILSLIDENKNRLANEVQATSDFDGI